MKDPGVKIINVRPKGLYVDVEFNLEALKKIEIFLSMSNVKFNAEENPEEAEAARYVVEEFYPLLKEFIKEIDT